MKASVNKVVYDIPFSLSDITLEKFIEYYGKYGKALQEEFNAILSAQYEDEIYKEIALDNHVDKEALLWFSFWTGHDFLEVQEEKFIAPILSQYRVLRYLLYEDMQKIFELPTQIEWNNETWVIQNFTVNPASEMTAKEVFTSKEVVLQIHKLGKSKWDALIYLCVVFFRKKDEPFKNEMVAEGSERIELMKQLPMEHALKVAFFERLCEYLAEHFSLFNNRGSGDSKPELIAYSEAWGWNDLHFAIAETKAFDIPGSGWNSFKCVEESKAFEVFTYASRNKDLNIAMKEAYKT